MLKGLELYQLPLLELYQLMMLSHALREACIRGIDFSGHFYPDMLGNATRDLVELFDVKEVQRRLRAPTTPAPRSICQAGRAPPPSIMDETLVSCGRTRILAHSCVQKQLTLRPWRP